MFGCDQPADTPPVVVTHDQRIPTRTLRAGMSLVERQPALLNRPGEFVGQVLFDGDRVV
jgi:hypothetical protein